MKIKYLILIPLLLIVKSAIACRCVEPDIAKAYKNSSVIVQVTAEDIISVPEGSGITAILNVSQSWKNQTNKKIAVNSLTSCYFDIQKDKEYILFLNIEPNGLYSTGKCVGNKPLNKADTLKEWLNENANKK